MIVEYGINEQIVGAGFLLNAGKLSNMVAWSLKDRSFCNRDLARRRTEFGGHFCTVSGHENI